VRTNVRNVILGACLVISVGVAWLLWSEPEPLQPALPVQATQAATREPAARTQPGAPERETGNRPAPPTQRESTNVSPTPESRSPLPPNAPVQEAKGSGTASALSQSAVSGSTPSPAVGEEKKASLGREEIRAAVRAVLPKVKVCYESALEHDPALSGTVKVALEIEAVDGKGKVVSGEVPDSETRSPFFEACVLETVANVEFPAPEGEGKLKVTYPFRFESGVGGFGGQE